MDTSESVGIPESHIGDRIAGAVTDVDPPPVSRRAHLVLAVFLVLLLLSLSSSVAIPVSLKQ